VSVTPARGSAKGRTPRFAGSSACAGEHVNVTEVPYERKPGDRPALSREEVRDVVAFLETLSDGFRP
jgi:cytochrome c peroxidase